MQRYFVTQEIHLGQLFSLEQDDLYHLKKVMRMKNGEQIICIDNTRQQYLCCLNDFVSGMIEPLEKLTLNNELDIEVTLIYALPKGDKFELVLQKACELGVSQIVPLLTKRCVVKMNQERFSKKLSRYRKILKEASEQSRRNRIPKIHNLITLKDINKYLQDYNLVAYEKSDAQQVKQLSLTLKTLQKGDHLVIIVGSEGGFELEEIQYLNNLGVKCCSLGKRILRSETAPLYLLSVISYSREVYQC